MKVFLLGRPGSGKSTVAQLIEMFARDNGWSTHHIDDYHLLQNMFLEEENQQIPVEQRKFRATGPKECNAFDVVDFSVLSEVLEAMKREVFQIYSSWEEEKKLYLLEFARDNYSEALNPFGTDFLQDSYFVYLDVDLEICIHRIKQRVPCDNFVSEYIMRHYYHQDDWNQLHVSHKYGLEFGERIRIIKNIGSQEQLENAVSKIAASLGLTNIEELVNV